MKKFFSVLVLFATISTCIFAKPRPNSPSSSSDNTSIAGVIFELLLDLSFYNNIMADFDNYPYATRPSYITLKQNTDTQFYRFTIDTNGFFTPGYNTAGNEIRLEGYIWKFFGPVFENNFSYDFNNGLKFGKMDLGMQFSLCQFSPFSMVFDIKWEHLYGTKYYNGVNFGFGFRSYPSKPLILEYRADWGLFSNSGDKINSDTGIRKNSTFKSHLEAGCMLNSPAEIYGFWDYTTDGFYNRKANSFGAGIKYHF